MRWRIRDKVEQDITVKHQAFLWWPMKVEGHWVWLETISMWFSPGYLHADGHWNYELMDYYL